MNLKQSFLLLLIALFFVAKVNASIPPEFHVCISKCLTYNELCYQREQQDCDALFYNCTFCCRDVHVYNLPYVGDDPDEFCYFPLL